MTDQNFDVYLRFLMENKDAKEGAQELIDAYEALSKSVEELGPEFKRGSTLWKTYMQPYQEEVKKAIDGMRKLGAANEQTTKTIADQNKVVQMQITNLRRQAREITTNVRLIRDSAQDIDRFARPLAMIGTATVGGIFAFASKYVKDAKEATEVTKAWKAAQASLEKSGQEIGAVLAEEALPLLKQTAKYMDMVANVLQKNPGIAGVALKGGLIALTLGTIGKAVAGGIRFYADLKFDAALTLQNTAAQLQLKASQNQLEAAGIQAGASKIGYGKPGGAIGPAEAGGSRIGQVLGIGTAVAASYSIASKIDQGFQSFQDTLKGLGVAGKIAAVPVELLRNVVLGLVSPLYSATKGFGKIGDLINKFLGLEKSASKAADAVGEVEALTDQQIGVA